MPSSTTFAEPASRGGDGLAGLMAGAVVLATAAIAGFCVLGTWWLLPVVLICIIVLAIGVTAALVHLIDQGEFPLPQLPGPAERQPAAAPPFRESPATGAEATEALAGARA
jgi:hypothetical protein